jgi:hypothetical protein
VADDVANSDKNSKINGEKRSLDKKLVFIMGTRNSFEKSCPSG